MLAKTHNVCKIFIIKKGKDLQNWQKEKKIYVGKRKERKKENIHYKIKGEDSPRKNREKYTLVLKNREEKFVEFTRHCYSHHC